MGETQSCSCARAQTRAACFVLGLLLGPAALWLARPRAVLLVFGGGCAIRHTAFATE